MTLRILWPLLLGLTIQGVIILQTILLIGIITKDRWKRGLFAHIATTTVDKCYKLHGYPPCYKPKVKTTLVTVNQVSAQSTLNYSGDQDTHGVGNFIKNLNMNQY